MSYFKQTVVAVLVLVTVLQPAVPFIGMPEALAAQTLVEKKKDVMPVLDPSKEAAVQNKVDQLNAIAELPEMGVPTPVLNYPVEQIKVDSLSVSQYCSGQHCIIDPKESIKKADTNGDGKLSPQEAIEAAIAMKKGFGNYATDANGFVDFDGNGIINNFDVASFSRLLNETGTGDYVRAYFVADKDGDLSVTTAEANDAFYTVLAKEGVKKGDAGYDSKYDFNRDGVIDSTDINTLAQLGSMINGIVPFKIQVATNPANPANKNLTVIVDFTGVATVTWAGQANGISKKGSFDPATGIITIDGKPGTVPSIQEKTWTFWISQGMDADCRIVSKLGWARSRFLAENHYSFASIDQIEMYEFDSEGRLVRSYSFVTQRRTNNPSVTHTNLKDTRYIWVGRQQLLANSYHYSARSTASDTTGTVIETTNLYANSEITDPHGNTGELLTSYTTETKFFDHYNDAGEVVAAVRVQRIQQDGQVIRHLAQAYRINREKNLIRHWATDMNLFNSVKSWTDFSLVRDSALVRAVYHLTDTQMGTLVFGQNPMIGAPKTYPPTRIQVKALFFAYGYKVVSVRNQNGQMKPQYYIKDGGFADHILINLNFGSGTVFYLIVGEPDFSSGENDDIRLVSGQTVNGWKVDYKVVESGIGWATFGLIFTGEVGGTFNSVYVDFPRERKVTLDGKEFKIKVDADGYISLMAPGQQPVQIPAGIEFPEFQHYWDNSLCAFWGYCPNTSKRVVSAGNILTVRNGDTTYTLDISTGVIDWSVSPNYYWWGGEIFEVGYRLFPYYQDPVQTVASELKNQFSRKTFGRLDLQADPVGFVNMLSAMLSTANEGINKEGAPVTELDTTIIALKALITALESQLGISQLSTIDQVGGLTVNSIGDGGVLNNLLLQERIRSRAEEELMNFGSKAVRR